jgi:hypothetical protein
VEILEDRRNFEADGSEKDLEARRRREERQRETEILHRLQKWKCDARAKWPYLIGKISTSCQKLRE